MAWPPQRLAGFLCTSTDGVYGYRIVVALRNKTFVYNFADLQLLDQVETADNLKGL
jgi:hypothetical protein